MGLTRCTTISTSVFASARCDLLLLCNTPHSFRYPFARKQINYFGGSLNGWSSVRRGRSENWNAQSMFIRSKTRTGSQLRTLGLAQIRITRTGAIAHGILRVPLRGRAATPCVAKLARMETITAPHRGRNDVPEVDTAPDTPWLVMVWNDPINLMSYVTWVFQDLFGYSRARPPSSCFRFTTQGQGKGG